MKTRKLSKKESTKFHNEVMKIVNRLVKRYNKRLKPLKKKGFKSTQIRKIFSDSVKELSKRVDKVKI